MIKKRIIPRKDYDKELNKWVPCNPDYLVECLSADVIIKCKDERILDVIYHYCQTGLISIRNIREYECVPKRW